MNRSISLSLCGFVGLFAMTALAGCGGGDNNGAATYTQVDRLARPVVNEVFASVANNRHQVNDTDNPTDDGKPGKLTDDIQSFMVGTAGRSQATTDVVKAVLIPDVMKADLTKTGVAGYLGVETGGATGSTFGGRKLSDDVVDTSLGVVFGNTVSALGLAPDDNKEIAALTTDNVGAGGKHFTATFPYLGAPQ